MKYIQIVAVFLLMIQAVIIPIHISGSSLCGITQDEAIIPDAMPEAVNNDAPRDSTDHTTEAANAMPEEVSHEAVNNVADDSSHTAVSREKNITLKLIWTRSAVTLSEEENERLMNDFNFTPGLSLTEEENERLMWAFSVLPETGLTEEENEKLMWAFNLLPEMPLKAEVTNTESAWDIDAISDTALSDEENERLMRSFNAAPGCFFNDGFIEGYVYLRKSDGEIMPVRDMRVDAWSDELDTGNEALTDETGRYQISGLREVTPEEAEIRGYLVETRSTEYLYQIYDQTDDTEDATRIETGRTDIDFYLETDSAENHEDITL